MALPLCFRARESVSLEYKSAFPWMVIAPVLAIILGDGLGAIATRPAVAGFDPDLVLGWEWTKTRDSASFSLSQLMALMTSLINA